MNFQKLIQDLLDSGFFMKEVAKAAGISYSMAHRLYRNSNIVPRYDVGVRLIELARNHDIEVEPINNPKSIEPEPEPEPEPEMESGQQDDSWLN